MSRGVRFPFLPYATRRNCHVILDFKHYACAHRDLWHYSCSGTGRFCCHGNLPEGGHLRYCRLPGFRVSIETKSPGAWWQPGLCDRRDFSFGFTLPRLLVPARSSAVRRVSSEQGEKRRTPKKCQDCPRSSLGTSLISRIELPR